MPLRFKNNQAAQSCCPSELLSPCRQVSKLTLASELSFSALFGLKSSELPFSEK